MQTITTEVIKKALPKKIQGNFNREMAERLDKVVQNHEDRDRYFRDIVTYSGVMKEGGYRLEDYFAAVRYVGFKLMGDTNLLSYTKTFPDKYQRMLNRKIAAKDIASYVYKFNTNQLVSKIYEQGIVPLYISHQDLAHDALTTLVRTMHDTVSDRVRIDAADRVLLHLKMPEVAKVQLDINVSEDDSIKDLRDATLALVRQQKEALEKGALSARDIAHSKVIVEGEVVVVED